MTSFHEGFSSSALSESALDRVHPLPPGLDTASPELRERCQLDLVHEINKTTILLVGRNMTEDQELRLGELIGRARPNGGYVPGVLDVGRPAVEAGKTHADIVQTSDGVTAGVVRFFLEGPDGRRFAVFAKPRKGEARFEVVSVEMDGIRHVALHQIVRVKTETEDVVESREMPVPVGDVWEMGAYYEEVSRMMRESSPELLEAAAQELARVYRDPSLVAWAKQWLDNSYGRPRFFIVPGNSVLNEVALSRLCLALGMTHVPPVGLRVENGDVISVQEGVRAEWDVPFFRGNLNGEYNGFTIEPMLNYVQDLWCKPPEQWLDAVWGWEKQGMLDKSLETVLAKPVEEWPSALRKELPPFYFQEKIAKKFWKKISLLYVAAVRANSCLKLSKHGLRI